MLETSARLLVLLSLLQARPEWPGGALAARLEVSPRTLRRDVDRLRGLGYPVDVRKGPGGGYRLGAGSELPPLLFDDEQAVAVAVALQTATTTVAGLEEASTRALTTIRQVMPSRLRQRLDALQVTTVGRARNRTEPQVDTEVLVAVGAAVRAREVLRFSYAAGSAQEATVATDRVVAPPRHVEPQHLITWGGRWYLVAWDLDRSDWRTFRCDRITPRAPTGPRFTPRELPAGNVTAFITGRFERADGPDRWPCRGEVLLDAPAALVARWAPRSGVVEELGPERCRLVLGSWSWVGLAAVVGTFDSDIEVVGPPELRFACAELSRRYAAAAAG